MSPALDRHAVRPHDRLQVGEPDMAVLSAEMRMQVDHHGAALHAGLRHVLDAQEAGAGRIGLPRSRRHGARRPRDVRAGTEAVVVERLGHAVAIGIEQLADMGQTVPLGRILRVAAAPRRRSSRR